MPGYVSDHVYSINDYIWAYVSFVCFFLSITSQQTEIEVSVWQTQGSGDSQVAGIGREL
jgi:hypothetical protein